MLNDTMKLTWGLLLIVEVIHDEDDEVTVLLYYVRDCEVGNIWNEICMWL